VEREHLPGARATLTGGDRRSGGVGPARHRHSRATVGQTMPPARPDLRNPPGELDALVDWFDRVSHALVLLDDMPLSDVRGAVAAFSAAVTAHRETDGGLSASDVPQDAGLLAGRQVLREDHDRFASSVRQLWWLCGIVEHEDHGGNRQALGQYGRLAAEALRRHRAEEREWFRRARNGPSGASVPSVPSNAK
jgi:hypothetical protein